MFLKDRQQPPSHVLETSTKRLLWKWGLFSIAFIALLTSCGAPLVGSDGEVTYLATPNVSAVETIVSEVHGTEVNATPEASPTPARHEVVALFVGIKSITIASEIDAVWESMGITWNFEVEMQPTCAAAINRVNLPGSNKRVSIIFVDDDLPTSQLSGILCYVQMQLAAGATPVMRVGQRPLDDPNYLNFDDVVVAQQEWIDRIIKIFNAAQGYGPTIPVPPIP